MGRSVIQVIQAFGRAGGAERVAWELATAFGRAGLSSRALSTVIHNADAPAVDVALVSRWIGRIPIRGAWGYVGRLLVHPLFTLSATVALRRHAGAVVISHGDCLAGDILVIHAVNAESLAVKRRRGEWMWLLNPIHLWVSLRDRWMIGGLRYACYVAVSQRVSHELQHHYRVPASRIRIIPNGIDLNLFQYSAEARLAVRQQFGIPDGAKVLVFVSHEFHRKGLSYVMDAVENLGEDVWLLVVGSDNPAPYRRRVVKARDRVVFVGTRKDTDRFYAAADALVLPTAYETFSLVCMEAMSCGLPVFATQVGGIEDYLVDGHNGRTITLDATMIEDTLRRTLFDEALMDKMRRGARDTALHYDWDRIAARYVALIDDIASAKARGPSGTDPGRRPAAFAGARAKGSQASGGE